ncbi:SUMF1/EgtB/PvdO family nonheme iron enzyme [Leptolyngbya cf. ectocarpi LEGE 11479]|uniref:SUMF1/EgtB/PvdO family nonheme iron enzyme n=1 Tax=Leptolyngbya cf. ectocarpi LEGE 11479 TaxID=1828722 RepID=A0A928X2L2_LEPEC|nr:SUMF1/EgtB/PvdO family nonheme iron enzyme [Leptolyngbya ectocarpi]MBE9066409.1 SUMF1/EgtB/PvdO family nonheme iron enzyme [Leptolyngbya cf. ectocarpi LEGE 11479]
MNPIGNVYEWCADDVHQNYEDAPENADIWLSGNDDGQKIMRGGSYTLKPQHCRSAFRASHARTTTQAMIGFRVVASV